MDLGVRAGRATLDAIYELHDAQTLAELRDVAMRGLRRTTDSDVATWSCVDPHRQTISTFAQPMPLPPRFALIAADTTAMPVVRRLLDRHPLDPATISDDFPGRQWLETFRYREVCRPAGCDHLIQVALGVAAEGSWQVLAGARVDRDYDHDERVVAGELARHLRQAHRRLTHREGSVTRAAEAAGLTARQAEALQAVADGATMRTAGARLGVAPKTVENYLQSAYRRLGVNSRVAALDAVAPR